MKTKVKLTICLIFTVISILLSLYLYFLSTPYHRSHGIVLENLPNVLGREDEYDISKDNTGSRQARQHTCTMESCFDFDKCTHGFKIYVYPSQKGEHISTAYGKIIHVIKKSIYYTDDATKACLFVLSLDTLDRDNLSKDYISNLGQKIVNLPHWNAGRNHIIFNLYSGTWPDYSDDINFDTGDAIIAKASFSIDKYRTGFDVSLPLFPQTQIDFGGNSLPFIDHMFPVLKKYKLVFKGKRYLNGVGSESRNSLHHIHNNKDIVMLTTCKHGRNWQEKKDQRCDKDNSLFDQYDYQELMNNASFCLIPRGRRLGSYRFIESLQIGCIPVILSNGWVLPYSDMIDWSKATLFADERLLTLIPSLLSEYSYDDIFQMKQHVFFLWHTYFSSVDKIVHTVFETIFSRINKHKAKNYEMWNNFPGALHLISSYSLRLQDYPFFYQTTGLQPSTMFTAVIYAKSTIINELSHLYHLIKTVGQSKFLSKIIVLWTAKSAIPNKQWPSVNVKIVVRRPTDKERKSRIIPAKMIETDGILSLDEDIQVNIDEINFAFSVWHKFPQRIVGFPCRTHYWHQSLTKWRYSSQWKNECSMVLTTGAFYHKYYNYYYTHRLTTAIRDLLASYSCEDIAMNFVISDVTRQPPVNVLAFRPYRKHYSSLYETQESFAESYYKEFDERMRCFDALTEEFGYMPLLYTNVRLDPVLYKDPVSNFRKKYKLLEL